MQGTFIDEMIYKIGSTKAHTQKKWVPGVSLSHSLSFILWDLMWRGITSKIWNLYQS